MIWSEKKALARMFNAKFSDGHDNDKSISEQTSKSKSSDDSSRSSSSSIPPSSSPSSDWNSYCDHIIEATREGTLTEQEYSNFCEAAANRRSNNE